MSNFDKLEYSKNLFYSKLDFDSFTKNNNITRKNIINNLSLTHLFYMSYPNESIFNISFKEMDNLLMNFNALTYVLNGKPGIKNINKYIMVKEVIKKKIKGGNIFHKKLKNMKKYFKPHDNHSTLCSNRWPDITLNELTFCVILNYFCTSPPIVLNNKKIMKILDNTYDIFIKKDKKFKKRSDYLKQNLVIKKEFHKIFKKMSEQNIPINKQILLKDNKVLKSKYLKNFFYLYDKPTKTKPYIYIFERKLFLTIKGTQTIEQVKQDFLSLYVCKISIMIDNFIKEYVPDDDYRELLNMINSHYGKYEYSFGFFIPVLHVLQPILQYMMDVQEEFDEIYIIGHSLGGAEATVFGILFLYIKKLKKYGGIFKNKAIKVVTFGEPSGLKNNKMGQTFVKKINSEMGDMFKYVRVVSFFKEDDDIYKDIVVTGNPLGDLFIEQKIKLKDLPKKEKYKVVLPNGNLFQENIDT